MGTIARKQVPTASKVYAGHFAGQHGEEYRLTDSGQLNAGEEDDECEDAWPTRMPNSTLRYTRTPVPPRRVPNTSARVPAVSPRQVVPRTGGSRKRAVGVLRGAVVGVFLLIIVVLGGGIAFVLLRGAITNQLNDWQYGKPRTYQVDAVVGQDDSASSPTHFIALNLDGNIKVIELPGGSSAHARVYDVIQLGPGDAGEPVTLSFGPGTRPMMFVHILGLAFAYSNDGIQFKPLQ